MQNNSFLYIYSKMLYNTLKEEISEYLRDRGITISWLARNINLSEGHARNIIRGTGKGEKTLTPKHLDRINNALGTDFKFPETEEPD